MMNGPCVQSGVSLAEMILCWPISMIFPQKGCEWDSYPDVSHHLEGTTDDERDEDPCSCPEQLIGMEKGTDEEESGEDACGCQRRVVVIVFEVIAIVSAAGGHLAGIGCGCSEDYVQ